MKRHEVKSFLGGSKWKPSRRASLAFVAAGLSLSGCAASQEAISEYATSARQLESEAVAAMHAGDNARAATLFQTAQNSFDTSKKEFFDGHLYVDQARYAGNQAFLALERGDEQTARDLFGESVAAYQSGIHGHLDLLSERDTKQQGAMMLAGIGASVGLGLWGASLQSGAASAAEAAQFQSGVTEMISTTGDVLQELSDHLRELNTLDVADEAKYVDIDRWRSAVISDHPIARSIVRIRADNANCTGFFIHPFVVATAAHCLDERSTPVRVFRNNPAAASDFLVGNPGAELTTVDVLIPASYDGTVEHPDDVALVVVAQRSSDWLKIADEPLAAPSTGMVIGYSGDLDSGFFPRLDYGCSMRPGPNGSVKSDCATYQGNSGGPFFAVSRDGTQPPEVIGINSYGRKKEYGTRMEDGVTAAGVHRLASLYRQVAVPDGVGNPALFD